MISHPAIRIGTCASLRSQPGLSRLLEIMSRESLGPSSGVTPDFLIILDLPDGAVACLEAVVDSERIAKVGPIVSECSHLDRTQRRDLWQAGIDWARSSHAAAIQILCDPHSEAATRIAGSASLGDMFCAGARRSASISDVRGIPRLSSTSQSSECGSQRI